MAIGMIMLAFVLSIMAGMKRDMINQGTSLLLGHMQIHAKDYRPDRSIYDAIPAGRSDLLGQLRGDPSVLGAAPRVSTFGLASSGNKSIGVEILGMEAAAERNVTILHEKLIEGSLPEPSEQSQIAIGELAAKALGVSLGGEVILIAQAADGSLGNDLFTVSGIFRSGLDLLDGGMAILDLGAAQSLIALPAETIHEIALRTASPTDAKTVASALERTLANPAIEVSPWQTLTPELSSWVAMSDSWSWIMYVIVFSLAAISVLNTMLMAVFERLREFGVLAAIGMKPRSVVALIVIEVTALAGVSLLVAIAIGTPLLRRVVGKGIDLSSFSDGFSVTGVAVGPIIRGDWVFGDFAVGAALLFVCAALAGLYPAMRAAAVDPARLTRGEIR